ncbi:methyltransferase domain-containing protein [Desulfosarcina sp.]|uniref:methyltransferase domain-containing protein n=1 Tax=Desulfosarcina sp. TaxID=2027861 RepID=UPI0039711511
MQMKAPINIFAMLAVMIAGAALFLIAFQRITIDTDIVQSLPRNDPVIADGIHIFEKNPIKDQIAIDIGSTAKDDIPLLAAAERVEARLLQSGLFAQVGTQPIQQGLAELADQVTQRLPVLFTAGELQRQIAPLLSDERIRQALTQVRDDLYQMDGIGQASTVAADPLGLRHIVLERLTALNPVPGATIRHGRIRSADQHHLLILATPAGSSTDTTVARSLARFFQELQTDLKQDFGEEITLTPSGAFKAALDNETIIRRDVHRAVLWATLGISVLLLAAFSNPVVGLLALLPALAGTVLAFFVFSLVHDSISIMVLGFGGAIISITVDHGIAYMLFVDKGGRNSGKQASEEVRAVGLLAVLTSIGAFGVLAFSGFTVFEQLGQFTAMGIGFSFLFVHSVFPRILRDQRPAAATTRRRLSTIVNRLASTGKSGLALALLTAALLAVFIRPHFSTNLKAMNSVSRETRSADELMTRVWGDIFSSVYLMTEANDLNSLQEKNDQLLAHLETETHAGSIQKPVTPSRFFPGSDIRRENFRAWRQFWTEERVREVSGRFIRQGESLGFTYSAFAPFLHKLAGDPPDLTGIPERVLPLLGISKDKADGQWRQVTRITAREGFDSQRFYSRMSSICFVFDPALFSERMGQLLFGTFFKMLLIIGVSLILLLVVFFADAGLLFTALLPMAFAFVCTLGTLGVMGRPLDIPALMLSVIILGMGVDYTLFMVRGYQRYQRFDHPHFALVRTAICMAAASTLVGFAVLLVADHNLLKSAGLISFFGIGYCLVGALLILPPLLKRRFESLPAETGGIAWRYRNMEPYPRMFAQLKERLDPLFDEIATLVPKKTDIVNILDVGCGYGVPACWMAERYPGATIYGIDPDPERVRVAALALGDRGRICIGWAPDLPPVEVLIDLATMLDVAHFLKPWELEKTLQRIHERMLPGGCLIIRSVMPPSSTPPWTWHLERLKLKINGTATNYLDKAAISAMLDKCDFEMLASRPSGKRGDMQWHVARPK